MAYQLYVTKRLISLCTLLLLLGCTAAPIQARELQVVDIAFTPARPVPGAAILVIYTYQEVIPGHSATYCRGVEFTRAGADGRFSFREEGLPLINVHQVGFSRPSKGVGSSKGQVVLRSDATTEEQLDHLSSLLSSSVCLGGGRNTAIAAFLETALPDLQALPPTPESKKLLSNFQRVIKSHRELR